MKIDLVTKCILTVIAVALVWIGIQLTPSATAGPEIQAVDIISIGGCRVESPQVRPIPVRITK